MKNKDSIYWDYRYKTGGNSGKGSYSTSAELKGNFVSKVIENYNIYTINDLGHGDGNQLKYFKGNFKYFGFDISETIRKKVESEFRENDKVVIVDSATELIKADLCLSLDVLYHITDIEEWKEYIGTLFNLGEFVLIYAQDSHPTIKEDPHVVSRPFTSYIQDNFLNYELIETSPGAHSSIMFYLYREVNSGK